MTLTPEPLLLVPPRAVRPLAVDLPAPPCHPLEADHPAAGGAAAGAGGGRPGGLPADEAHQEGNGHQDAGLIVILVAIVFVAFGTLLSHSLVVGSRNKICQIKVKHACL